MPAGKSNGFAALNDSQHVAEAASGAADTPADELGSGGFLLSSQLDFTLCSPAPPPAFPRYRPPPPPRPVAAPHSPPRARWSDIGHVDTEDADLIVAVAVVSTLVLIVGALLAWKVRADKQVEKREYNAQLYLSTRMELARTNARGSASDQPRHALEDAHASGEYHAHSTESARVSERDPGIEFANGGGFIGGIGGSNGGSERRRSGGLGGLEPEPSLSRECGVGTCTSVSWRQETF